MNTNYAAVLHWQRCPEGTEIEQGPNGSAVMRYRTDNREPYTRRLDRIGEAVALQCVNAKTDALVLDFVARFGFPFNDIGPGLNPTDSMSMQAFAAVRDSLGMFLDFIRNGEYTHAYNYFQILTHLDTFDDKTYRLATVRPELFLPPSASRPILSLRADNLMAYMILEVATLASGNTAIMRCINDANIFVSGTAGGKRLTARYCSNRCRVAHQRALLRAEETTKRKRAATTR